MMIRNLFQIGRGQLGAFIASSVVAGCCLGTPADAAEKAVHTYPLDHCIVSGDLLDVPESIVTIEFGLREIRFCGADCSDSFAADAEGYLRQLDAAIIETQLPGYPMTTCLKSGQPLGGMGEPYDHVYGNRLVRLCCAGCIGGFEKNAAELLAVLDQAAAEQQAAGSVEE